MNKIAIGIVSFLFVAVLWNNQVLTSYAEEIKAPGYHEYVTTEDEVIDTWYGIAKGTYLESGISGLNSAGKAKVNVSGTTNAYSVCDKVKVAVYLDESDDGGKSFGTIGSYYFEEANSMHFHNLLQKHEQNDGHVSFHHFSLPIFPYSMQKPMIEHITSCVMIKQNQ